VVVTLLIPTVRRRISSRGRPAFDCLTPWISLFLFVLAVVAYLSNHQVGTEFVLDVRYELIKPIGHGAYGVVISAVDHVTGHKVAIKKCPSAFEDLVDAKRIVREIRLLMHFNHENIVKVGRWVGII